MNSELYDLTQVFNDPKPCNNEDCKEGFIYTYDEVMGPEKEKCPYCDENGHLKE